MLKGVRSHSYPQLGPSRSVEHYCVAFHFSMFVQKLDTLRWTPYAEESLAILTKNHASIEDLLLVQIVRLNLIQERVKEAPWFDTASSGNAAFTAPSSFYLNALKVEMKNFRLQIPPELKNNETLLMHLYNTEVTIHEVGLSKEPTFDMDDFSRLDSLCACLQAAKAWFEIYLNIPGSDYPGFSFPIYTHLAHCIVALYRLSVFEHTNWDIGMVRRELDLSVVLEKVVKMFESVKEASGLDTEDCDSNFETNNIMVYSTMGKRIGQIKTWWNAKMAAENSANNVVNNSMGAGEVTDTMGTNPFAVEPIQDFWPGDDTWWQDVFGPWNIQVDPMTM
ncbi:Zn(II)2Cys6 transcription factor protein [Rutstroemia sp. NJR-2017a BBW]|nr:Zn(II)2Cys6 transcription factor protein [Rutstroemia sp. NJR-2017a BBW]